MSEIAAPGSSPTIYHVYKKVLLKKKKKRFRKENKNLDLSSPNIKDHEFHPRSSLTIAEVGHFSGIVCISSVS